MFYFLLTKWASKCLTAKYGESHFVLTKIFIAAAKSGYFSGNIL